MGGKLKGMDMPDKTIVHIGMFADIPGTRTGPAIRDDAIHLCYELDDCSLNRLVQRVYDDEVPFEYKDRVKLEFRDGADTGLDSESVDEVHLYNVLGVPSVTNRSRLLDESYRVLKYDGFLYSGESMTPSVFPPWKFLFEAASRKYDVDIIVPDVYEYVSEATVSRFKGLYEKLKDGALDGREEEFFSLLERMNLHSYGVWLKEEDFRRFAQYRGVMDEAKHGYLLKLMKR